ncbi:MAG: putative metal-dependent hydrolase [Sphingobacteriales bacterium]|nr:MAG: putative metal-dependent hydrolase [Sphingobacteriales bacterium]
MQKNIEELKYPIGKFKAPKFVERNHIEEWIKVIKEFPVNLTNEIVQLAPKELEKRYRPQGWTIRQIVHHCADSHMNSFIRFKLGLTEDVPTIKPYHEDLWAELSDSNMFPVNSSLILLKGLHERWVHLLLSLSAEELERQFKHPESGELISLKINIGIYAWHCEHHLAHIRNAKMEDWTHRI